MPGKKLIDVFAGLEPERSDILAEAVSGRRGDDQQRIAVEGVAWIQTLLAKNSDYGGSAWKRPVLKPTMEPGDAILARMSDKVERIGRLSAGESPEVAESLRDTISDLGAYCLLWLTLPRDA